MAGARTSVEILQPFMEPSRDLVGQEEPVLTSPAHPLIFPVNSAALPRSFLEGSGEKH